MLDIAFGSADANPYLVHNATVALLETECKEESKLNPYTDAHLIVRTFKEKH